MPCHNASCTCCRDAYLEGLQDGYRLGYKRGYVRGYVDGLLRIPPPEEYCLEIQTRLNTHAPRPRILSCTGLITRKQWCTCIGYCTCH